MEGLYVKARVGKKLKKWLEDSYQDSVVRPKKGSVLVTMIIPFLELRPKDYVEDLPDDETIEIELPLKRNEKVYCQSTGKVYYCNTIWRNTLSKAGHKKVKWFFETTFRKAFHTFMDGHIEGQHEKMGEKERLEVKAAVCAFLNQYHIEYDERMISSMTRDWWRHVEENEKNRISPMVY